jgi:hypothetical protein
MRKTTILYCASEVPELRRLPIGDTADYQSALRGRGRDVKRHLSLCIKGGVALLFILFLASGCESTEEHALQASAGGYYGVGYSDPWYYGDTYYPPDVVVTPPRPVDPPHVEHPIALPPSTPVATPLPSIPSAPRVAPRR